MSQKSSSLSSRILSFDLLRGYFLLAIILNHLQWYPNGLDWVALHGSLVVSAAEGFFLISGIVLGIIRGQKLLKQPFKVAALQLLSRGVKLYIISIALMLLFTLAGWLFLDNPGLKPGIRPFDQPFFEIFIGALSFEYIYGWADFLRLYAIFIIASPFFLWLLRKGKWYIGLAASVGVWALYPFALAQGNHSPELLMVLTWQLIFFIGFTIGFYWDKLQAWWKNVSHKTQKYILTPILIVAATTLIANILIVLASYAGIATEFIVPLQNTLAVLTPKEALSPLRLFIFGLWFILGYYLVSRYQKQIVKWFGWILIPFGHNSLYVYILHAVILFFAHLIMAPDSSTNILINAVGSLIIIGLILLAVRKRFLFKIIPR